MPVTAHFEGAASPVGSRVRFDWRGTVRAGTVTELQRWRALVATDDGEHWRVPYQALNVLQRAPAGGCSLAEAEAVALDLMGRYKALGDLDPEWRFGFDLAPSRAGACKYAERCIVLAVSYCLGASRTEIADTLLHEIAHAIVGPGHNHDAVWRAKARQIGCSAERCHGRTHTLAKWIGECGCGRRWLRHRLQRRIRRGACCPACGKIIAWRPNTPVQSFPERSS